MTKVVIDTSVFVSAFLSKSKNSSPAQILTEWRQGSFTLVISPQILQELVVKLLERNIAEEDISDLVRLIAEIADCIPGAVEATRLNDVDPDDNMFLAAAYESGADYLVSLDRRHILPIKHFQGTQIVEPLAFLCLLLQKRC